MEELIKIVKRELKITWKDEDTDAEVEALVSDAVPAMNHKLGIKEEDSNYTKAGAERRLFINYCQYAWNNCLNDFDKAYINEIMQLRAKHEVKYAKRNEDL